MFRDLVRAFNFMTLPRFAIEKLDHHPEWFKVDNKVCVHLTTHDVGGISALDFEPAAKLDALNAAT